jgi:CRP-like cAMP-binding protein
MEHQLSKPINAISLPARPVRRADDPLAASILRAAGSPDPLAPDARVWAGLLGAPALGAAEQQALAAVARARSVPAGAEVFRHDEPARSLVLVRNGDVALGWRTADGVFHIERPVRGPAWLDQASAWLEGTHAMDALASAEAVVVELPRDALLPVLERYPGLARRLIASLAREAHALAANTHELMHKDAPARFAAWLAQRCDADEGASQHAVVRLGERKRDIASQLAITPETLSRLMRSLSRQGIISVAGYTVQVLDLPALRRAAETS